VAAQLMACQGGLSSRKLVVVILHKTLTFLYIHNNNFNIFRYMRFRFQIFPFTCVNFKFIHPEDGLMKHKYVTVLPSEIIQILNLMYTVK
jgi:hypothetical protein